MDIRVVGIEYTLSERTKERPKSEYSDYLSLDL